jgi:hypothetical protein
MSDDATTPIGFLEDCYASGGGQAVAAAFTEWERWCDEVFDSHTAYPMLAMFRSRQPGQNWLTALGVVLDAATICLAAVDSPRVGPAARLWRRASRTLQSLRGMPTALLRPVEPEDTATEEAPFREAYERLRGLGVPLHPYERAWSEFRRLREVYVPGLLTATRLLLVPLEFRHQTARLDITRSG